MYPSYNKPAFMTNTATTSFGASTSTFGQPPANTSMFSSMQPSNIFQAPNTSSFNAGPTAQSNFGTNLFGQQQQQQPSTTGLFGSSNAFSQNKTSFGFGATPAQPGVFGQQLGQQPQQQTGTSLFPSTTPNLFGSNAFGNQTTGTVIKFSPVTGTDTMQKNGVTQSISTKHHCITCMKEYEGKSLEELRHEDYQSNRKGPQQHTGFGGTPFGGSTAGTSAPLFGQAENKPGFGQSQAFGQTPAFGQATPAFGVPNQTAAPTIFGKPNTFGAPTSTAPSFGFNAATATANPFSSNQPQKPFSQPLFGTTTTQAQPSFGTGVFGQTSTQNTATNLFQKPAQPATGFNTGQQGFSFTQPTTQASNLFQVSKPNTGFGIFGQTTTAPAFGQATQPSFGSNFGKITQPTFAQTSQPTFGTNLTGGLQPQPSLFGAGASKPPSLFGATNTGGGLFNNNVFQQTATPFSLNLNQQQSVQFPPEPTEDNSIHSIVTDSFPDGPHIYGLEPVQGEVKTATNPKDLKQLLESSKKRDESMGARAKIRVQIPKPKRGNNFNNDFFETNVALRNSHKRLVIKKFKETNNSSIYGKYNNELLDEAEDCLRVNQSSDSFPTEGADDYNSLNIPGNVSFDQREDSEQSSDYKARINKLRLHFDSFGDETEVKTNKDFTSPMSASVSSSNIGGIPPNIITLTNPKVSETDNKSPVVVPPLDIVDDDQTVTEVDDDLPVASSILEAESTDNPAGVILTKPEYYMYPALKDLGQYIDDNGECIVQGLTIGRRGYGNIYFPDPIDISNMNFDEIVHFRHREVTVYPSETTKPPIGEGLNRRAQVTLDKVYPREKGTSNYVLNPTLIMESDFVEKLMHVTVKHKTKFVDYRPKTGSWVFKVKHFSRYGFTDSDDENCEIGMEKESPKKAAATVLKQQEEVDDITMLGLGGGDQLLKRRLIPNEEDSFTMESISLDMWPEKPYNISDEMYPADATNQKSSLFTNLDFLPKESSRERLITTHRKPIRSEVIATPKVHKLPDISLMLQPNVTTTQRCCLELGIFRNNSHKVGWGPGLTFYNIEPTAESEVIYELAHSKINIDNSQQYNSMMPDLINMLNVTFEESEFSFNNDIPTLHLPYASYLHNITRIFNKHAEKNLLTGQGKYLSSVWNLCLALWGPGDNTSYSRREYLSNWLQKLTLDMTSDNSIEDHGDLSEIEIFKTIFKLLSFHKVAEASKFALKNKMTRLSILISQMSANEAYKERMQKYIDSFTWKRKDIIVDDFKKVFLLLAGIPTHNSINICDGLDWMRNFGLHLWYIAPAAAPIDIAFNSYKKAFEENETATKPTPPYYDSETQTTEYDLLYHIMGIYVDSTYQLCNVLHPETHTANLLDYRLSWFIMQLFLSLKVGLIREAEKEYMHSTFSSQLESMGHWKWAIVVLLYLENDILKKDLITKLLDRNLSPFTETVNIERELVQVFKIPASWIHEVKATKTKAKGCYYDYFQHSIYMQDGQQANKAFVKYIGPELFVNEQYDYVARFIMELQPFASCLVNWSTEVGLFQDYFDLQKALSEEYEEGPIITSGKLASLLKRVNGFPVKNEQQKLCVAELSRKCALLFKMLYKKVEREEYYAKFADLFRNLLPEIKHHECFYIITNSLKDPVAGLEEVS